MRGTEQVVEATRREQADKRRQLSDFGECSTAPRTEGTPLRNRRWRETRSPQRPRDPGSEVKVRRVNHRAPLIPPTSRCPVLSRERFQLHSALKPIHARDWIREEVVRSSPFHQGSPTRPISPQPMWDLPPDPKEPRIVPGCQALLCCSPVAFESWQLSEQAPERVADPVSKRRTGDNSEVRWIHLEAVPSESLR